MSCNAPRIVLSCGARSCAQERPEDVSGSSEQRSVLRTGAAGGRQREFGAAGLPNKVAGEHFISAWQLPIARTRKAPESGDCRRNAAERSDRPHALGGEGRAGSKRAHFDGHPKSRQQPAQARRAAHRQAKITGFEDWRTVGSRRVREPKKGPFRRTRNVVSGAGQECGASFRQHGAQLTGQLQPRLPRRTTHTRRRRLRRCALSGRHNPVVVELL